ncbi:glycoside hydrolase family 18 protein [Cylindrobasidium torrendii FP15055 ss-10]|uniref:Glycoside hydrolase family 18 protein n=1 Tax=Cylindrobasidium torrendii FP15055 ss-10 TaxID=1314674 RepID=A0A0D7BTW7_9AGAR|nr:glycoside hydrolase family 18 protein [Cylindrobasidium torrendii FP15055 ss-10]
MIFNLLALSALPALARAQFTAGYFTGWHATEGFPLSSVSWDKYDAVAYAFAETTEDVHNLSLEGSNAELVPEFVALARLNDVKALVSIGGWTGSMYFSTAVGSAQNRTAFVDTVTKFAQEYQLDGLDFDWEYPGNQGLGCNTISPNDTSNYLLFLQELRQHPVGCELLITAAVSISPFFDESGEPGTNVSAFGEVFDYITVMNYDLWGSWSSSVGPNGPLDDSCASEENQQGSAVSAVKAWTSAGFPASKLILGLPGYGHSFSVQPEDAFPNGTDTLYPYALFNASIHPAGDSWDDAAGVDQCGVETAQGGNIDFWALIQDGYLDESGDPVEGVPYVFDECSQTPFVYNETSNVMISFDNAQSFAAKAAYTSKAGLGGVAIWEIGSDYKDILIDAARSELS